mgnify:CR=1 FL=1
MIQKLLNIDCMKKNFLLVCVLLNISRLLAQTDTVYLWPNAVPGETKPKAKPVITTFDDGITRTIEENNPFFAVFKPKEFQRNGKAIIITPGGGYVRVATVKEGYATASWLIELGYTVFVLQYRVPDKRAAALQDIQRTIKLVRSNAKKYRIDPNKIAAMGFSAGAHLVALAGMGKNEQTYDTYDQNDSVSSRPNRMIIIYPGYLDGGPNRTLGSEFTVSKETVPTFIFQTMDDNGAQNSFALAQALKNAGSSVELHMTPVGGHGYSLYKGNKAAEAWPKYLELWLKDFM